MRTNIKTNPAAFAEFSLLAQAPGNYHLAHTNALKFLQLSPHDASADDCYEAGGGDEITAVRDNSPRGGRPLTRGDLMLLTIRRSYPVLPEFLSESAKGRHFDGRRATPKRGVREDWRAAYALRHFDALELFDDAMALPSARNVLVSREDVSDELAAYIEAHAGSDIRHYFAWLNPPEPAAGRPTAVERAAS